MYVIKFSRAFFIGACNLNQFERKLHPLYINHPVIALDTNTRKVTKGGACGRAGR
jgi:hypothetical protein